MNKKEEELKKQINLEALPNHIAVIMDGNGRWAKKRTLPRIAGYREGIKTVRMIIETCRELGIKHLTLYTFSTENWSRPKKEVETLMNLLKEYIEKELNNMNKNGIRFNILGDWETISYGVPDKIKQAINATSKNDRLVLNLALNYGGRQEILRAAKLFAKEVSEGKHKPDDLDESLFSSYLYSYKQPDPDLMIRTSGEIRLSNFLLWQLAYAEFWITDILWPDFKKENLYQALIDFQKRERRFGSIG
jgi:undecaprenyl diphosphate synthase